MKFVKLIKAKWNVEKINENDWIIKSPDGTYKNQNGKDYHFKTKEDALEELDYLRAEHKFDKKESKNMKKKAADEITITISMDTYLKILEKELAEANDRWGKEASKSLTPYLLQLIEDVGGLGQNNDPDYIADNFVVNGEFISKEDDFIPENGGYHNEYEQYNGNWEEFCSDNALVYNDEYCCLRF